MTILIGLVSFGIIQASNAEAAFTATSANGLFAASRFGWTADANNWYGFIFLYTLVPTQNFYVLGTIFVVTFFYFMIFAPFVFNFMNRISFGSCTAFVCALGLVACFLSTWSDVFFADPNLQAMHPWFGNVTLFTNWFLLSFMFVFGFYMRKYTKVIPWRIALAMFGGFCALLFAAETAMDYAYASLGSEVGMANGFNAYYLGGGICSLPILLLSYLFINVCASYCSAKTPRPFVAAMNSFNESHQKYIPEQFIMVGIASRMIYGVLFLKVILGLDVRINTNYNLLVSGAVGSEWWGWSLVLVSVLVVLFAYGMTALRMRIFDAVEAAWNRKRGLNPFNRNGSAVG